MKNESLRRLAYTAAGTALAFVLLLLFGAVMPVGVVGAAALASFAVAAVVYLADERYAAACFLASLVLAFFFLPTKAPAVYFGIYFGAYPIFRSSLDKHSFGFVLPLIVKCAVAELAVWILLLLARPLGITLPFFFVLFGTVLAPLGALVYDFAFSELYRLLVRLLERIKKR